MHIYFAGIGGAGIGPLALIAHDAGYEVSGSDKQNSSYLEYLKHRGIKNIAVSPDATHLEQTQAKKHIDWLVYSSALPKENPNHPVIRFAAEHRIKTSKRDEFLREFLEAKNLKMIAVAGTHGKTTTTAMIIWLFKQLNWPISYSVGAKLGFGDMGQYDPDSQYFVYEADEYDRNFLAFKPAWAIITGIDWDHPDIYPTRQEYYQAFVDFTCQSKEVIAHTEDLERIGLSAEPETIDPEQITLKGEVNRQNAQLAVEAVSAITGQPADDLIKLINEFPGLNRRFEELAKNIYTDYAHTPAKIRGALQLAHELAGDNVVVVYEGLHNTRQHFIKDDLKHLFDDVKKLYVVPSYRAREDESLEDLTPTKLIALTSQPQKAEAAELNNKLLEQLKNHAQDGDLVLCLTAGGGGSLDEWLRAKLG